MGRPRPNSGEPAAGPDPGYGAAPYPPPTETQSAPAEPYPPPPPPPPPIRPAPAVPYPPPQAAWPQGPPAADGTPVAFPPSTAGGHAVTPPHNVSGASPYPQHIGDPWSSGLFDCNMNETNAIMTTFFPCVTFGQIAEILDEGQTSCTLGSFMYILMVPALLTCWILGSNYRQKLRQKYNLVEAPYEDWAVHLFCPCCALCQEFRELDMRGFDPSEGWMGHLAKQQQTLTTPPTNQFMNN